MADLTNVNPVPRGAIHKDGEVRGSHLRASRLPEEGTQDTTEGHRPVRLTVGKQQRIPAAEAVRMLEVYMSPTRLLENRQDSDAEIVARVESMLDGTPSSPTYYVSAKVRVPPTQQKAPVTAPSRSLVAEIGCCIRARLQYAARADRHFDKEAT